MFKSGIFSELLQAPPPPLPFWKLSWLWVWFHWWGPSKHSQGVAISMVWVSTGSNFMHVTDVINIRTSSWHWDSVRWIFLSSCRSPFHSLASRGCELIVSKWEVWTSERVSTPLKYILIRWMWRTNLTVHRKGQQRFWLHCHDCCCALTQTYNNCAETHLGGGVLSAFVLPLIAIVRSPFRHHICSGVHAGPQQWCGQTLQCVNEHVATLFSAWKLQIQSVTDLCKSPRSYWYPTASCCCSRECCELLQQHCCDETSVGVSIY